MALTPWAEELTVTDKTGKTISNDFTATTSDLHTLSPLSICWSTSFITLRQSEPQTHKELPAMSEDGSLSQSQLLSSSASSLSRSSGKQISQVYKQASQLFLTRRISEALSVLEPVITPGPDDQQQQQQQQQGQKQAQDAPIATASSNLRIKVWNLYITLLSGIVDLGPAEGKRQFGQKEWKAFASKVRDGGVWETVVQVGYKGREGSVDADVVYNLFVLSLSLPEESTSCLLTILLFSAQPFSSTTPPRRNSTSNASKATSRPMASRTSTFPPISKVPTENVEFPPPAPMEPTRPKI